ncbi:MAG: glycosyltransferase family 4 protein [Mucilaginibacter sp.]|nr:glycosyltransferase family 4 protein [Mucilaginibacter sp.]
MSNLPLPRLAIITTHPIQYYAPVFKLLHQRGHLAINVFYTWGRTSLTKYDPDFGQQVDWDIPLLEGYPYQWVENTASNPGSHHFKGIVNPGLIAQINQWQPTAILIFGWAYASHLRALVYYKGKLPVCFRGDSTLLDQTNGLRTVLRTIFLKWVYSHVEHSFYTGINNKAYFKKHGLKEEQLSFAPHAIDNDRFAEDHFTEATGLRNSLGISASDMLILFSGKLEDKKDPVLLLQAFLQLNLPHVHLLFAGSGALKSTLQQRIQGNKHIHFIDFQNQGYMPVVYQACDLYCLPSKGPGETWGLAVNEAMACGKAIVVSDKVGCAADLVKKDNGIIVKSQSLNELLTTLQYFTGNPARLRKFGRQSAQIISDYSFLAVARAIEQAILADKNYIAGNQ